MSADAGLGLGLAGCLVLLAFLTTGGEDLGPNTWAEITLTLLGSTLCIAVLLLGAPGRAWGAVTLSLFAALAALTAVSIAWSVQPDNSWLEANRTLSYLAAFAGAAALARLVPARWPALVGAIALLAIVLSASALLVKIFPATLDAGDALGRLSAPFGYWNATGLIAALGLAPCLWAGARREHGRVLRALTVPAVGILITVVVLSYSRAGVLVAVVGLVCWFALVPLRLRAALVLATGTAGAAAMTGWALGTHSFTHDKVLLAARTTTGHSFGLVLILSLALLIIAGFAVTFAMDRIVLPGGVRRRVGVVLVTLVALVPVGGVVALAASSRGITGEISHAWTALTKPRAGVTDRPGRLVELGSSRPLYWSEGLAVGEHALLKGTGALGYLTARTRYTSNPNTVEHAHSYVIETFADFGLIGIALSLGLLVAWGIAAGRSVTARASWASLPGDQASERGGLVTLLVVVFMFGVHSAIDWTWFIPGVTVPALLCAGWLAGRGPLASPVGRAAQRRSLLRRPGAGAIVTGLATLALLAAWIMAQPLRSADADASADVAAGRGNTSAALADARAAATRDPLSVEPLFELSALYGSVGDRTAAYAELLRAVRLQPQNTATWLQLGDYELQQHAPRRALTALRTALELDRSSLTISSEIAQAQGELRSPHR